MPETAETGSSGATYKLTLDGDGVKVAKEIDADLAAEVLGLVISGSNAKGSMAATRRRSRMSPRARQATGTGGKKTRRRAGSVGMVKDLSLQPTGKRTFIDFANEKGPKGHHHKQVVIVYWLRHEAAMTAGITADHVNTCYSEANWSRPADLRNNLQVTAGKKGWLDTSDMNDIKITTRGEDEVRHNLPPKPKKRQK